MDFVGSGGGGNGNNVANIIGSNVVTSSNGGAGVVTTNVGGSLGSENGPILYSEPNRTSAIDDIRSVVIYIFIITIFLSFFLILPGIRYEKFPTFLCITTSLIVTSIILVTIFGTSWHVGEAPISAAYKAFSRDRIQGDLSVRIGLQSVNITLQAHKYYILHATHGPIIMENSPIPSPSSPFNILQQVSTSSPPPPTTTTTTTTSSDQSSFFNSQSKPISRSISEDNHSKVSRFLDDDASAISINPSPANNLAEELLGGRTSDGATVDTELEVEEVFANSKIKESSSNQPQARRTARSSSSNETKTPNGQVKKRSTEAATAKEVPKRINNSSPRQSRSKQHNDKSSSSSSSSPFSPSGQKYTIKRVNVDINYNERFYWIEPNQMRQEYLNALERGLPYPILTVVEYLSQDAAGFSWSRQYRLAGYYTHIILWLSLCVCILMFFLHCAAPKYGIYTMQIVGCLMLFTNFTYATLVPRGEQKLVIPFEGRSLTFDFGWNFKLVLFGGCLSLAVGTLINIIDRLFPNFIFTTVLDVDFDSQNKYYKHRMRRKCIENEQRNNNQIDLQRPVKPPFFHDSSTTFSTTSSSSSSPSLTSTSKTNSPLSSIVGSSSRERSQQQQQYYNNEIKTPQLKAIAGSANNQERQQHSDATMTARHRLPLKVTDNDAVEDGASHSNDLFVDSSKRSALTSDSEFITTSKHHHHHHHHHHHVSGQDSSVVEILEDRDSTGVDESLGTPATTTTATSDTYPQNRLHRQHVARNGRHHHHHNNRANKNNISTTDHLSRRQVVTTTDDSTDDHQVRL